MYSLSHSKPRRLQWTWLGHGELRLGGWTLHVSTLQMFVLLHFNTQEVRIQPGLGATGVLASSDRPCVCRRSECSSCCRRAACLLPC